MAVPLIYIAAGLQQCISYSGTGNLGIIDHSYIPGG